MTPGTLAGWVMFPVATGVIRWKVHFGGVPCVGGDGRLRDRVAGHCRLAAASNVRWRNIDRTCLMRCSRWCRPSERTRRLPSRSSSASSLAALRGPIPGIAVVRSHKRIAPRAGSVSQWKKNLGRSTTPDLRSRRTTARFRRASRASAAPSFRWVSLSFGGIAKSPSIRRVVVVTDPEKLSDLIVSIVTDQTQGGSASLPK